MAKHIFDYQIGCHDFFSFSYLLVKLIGFQKTYKLFFASLHQYFEMDMVLIIQPSNIKVYKSTSILSQVNIYKISCSVRRLMNIILICVKEK